MRLGVGNPRNPQKNLINVIQENLNFQICILNLRRLQSVKQRKEPNCCVSRADMNTALRGTAWVRQQGVTIILAQDKIVSKSLFPYSHS